MLKQDLAWQRERWKTRRLVFEVGFLRYLKRIVAQTNDPHVQSSMNNMKEKDYGYYQGQTDPEKEIKKTMQRSNRPFF